MLPVINTIIIKILTHRLSWVLKSYSAWLSSILYSKIKGIFVLTTSLVVKTTVKNILPLLLFFKTHSLCRYTQLIDITTEDVPKNKNRFRITYILSSFLYSHKLLLTLTAHELYYIPSVISLFSSAGWLEREVWDLYGLYFSGNVDLRRILTDYGFLGHPLRKEFPLSGFSEIYYSLDINRIITTPTEFAQTYRVFHI